MKKILRRDPAHPRRTGPWGFIPYLAVVLINAMIDLGHKIVIQNTIFKCYDGSTQIGLTALVNACILLPFILFFTPAGFLADRFPKHLVMRWTAAFALPLTVLITVAYVTGRFETAFILTLILAAQSAFYSPAKYGYIREMAGKDNLGMANGVVQAVTIVAILLGGVLFSQLFETLIGQARSREEILMAVAPCGFLLMAGALAQTIVAWRIPAYRSGDADLHLNMRSYVRGTYLKTNLGNLWRDPSIRMSVLGLSLFWAVNQVLLAAFGAHLKEMAGETSTVVAQGLLAIGGVGIIAGSVTAGRLSRNHIETGLVPLAAIGMTVCMGAIPFMSDTFVLGTLLAVYGFFGGLFVVPLNALIQFNAPESESGAILAGNNFVQNVFMLSFLGATVLMSMTDLGSAPFILGLAGIMALGAVFSLSFMLRPFLCLVLRFIFGLRYRLTVSGLEHFPAKGGVLLLGNHTSWIDWAMLYLAAPRPMRFVMSSAYYNRRGIRWFFDLYRAIPISPTANRAALRKIADALKSGDCVALFPEGAISRNGQLGEFRRGFSIPAVQSGCPIIPFYLNGLWGSRWSAVTRHFRRNSGLKRVRDVHVGFGPPLPSTAVVSEVKNAVRLLSVAVWSDFSRSRKSIPENWLRVAARAPRRPAVADSSGRRLSVLKLFHAALQLSRTLHRMPAKSLGVMLPPGASGLLANLAVLMAGKTAVNLDPSLDGQALARCREQAGIRTVLTSSSQWDNLEAAFDLEPFFVEIPKSTVTQLCATRIILALPFFLARFFLPVCLDPHGEAAVFVDRDGVVSACLSHADIITFVRQMASLFPPEAEDTMLSAEPLHRSWGLTIGAFMPLLEFVPLVCHHDPLDVRGVGRLCVRHRASVLCSGPEALCDYVQNEAMPALMLDSVRLVLSAGGELPGRYARGFREKFGLAVHHGYGLGDAMPVVAVNARDILNPADMSIQYGWKSGSAGLPLPGSAVRVVRPGSRPLEDAPQGERGLIFVCGVRSADSERDSVEQDGLFWHPTGDTGYLDEDGFLVLG